MTVASTSLHILLPGQPVRETDRSVGGLKTYTRDEHTLSSLAGQVETEGEISGIRGTGNRKTQSARFVVPSPGATVLGRVTRVNARQANVSILVVDGVPCTPGDWSACRFTNNAAGEDPTGADFTGVIRSQDVRLTDKDNVKMADCFRPGDIVRATVISLGDARSYFLATTANHLGVVYALPAPTAGMMTAQSANQSPLIPLNWQEMQDPTTGTIEKRKVAKPLDA